jgi:hypothetical protein
MTFESKRRSFGAPSATRPPLRGPKGDKGNPGAVGPAGADGALVAGARHVHEFGAIARGIGDTVSADECTANTVALNAACAAIFATGGTLFFGGGGETGAVYHVNGPWGFVVTEDTNVRVTLQGLGPFPGALVYSNNTSQENFRLHSTIPNIRNIYVKDMQFLGGRTAVSLVRCFYSRFERCWFWGATQFAVQIAYGGDLVFHGCFFTETGAFGDALFLYAAQALFSDTTWGEAGGGVVMFDSALMIKGGVFQAACFYRGKDYTDYWTTPGTPVTQSLAFYYGEESCIIAANSDLDIDCRMYVVKIGISIDLGHNIKIAGQFLTDGAAFEGFINVMRNSAVALKVDGQFRWNFQTGYFIKEVAALLHDSMINAQFINQGGTITALGTSAPALVNPGGENNLVTTRTFTV